MKYTPEYFPFDKLHERLEIAEIFAMVALVYAVLFSAAWIYTRFLR